MTKIPVATAAKMAGVQRSTLYRKRDKGGISFDKDENGNNIIDASELLRVYPNAKVESDKTQHVQQSQKQHMLHDATDNKNKLLQQELVFLREKLADKEKQLDEAKEREQDLSKKLDTVIENAAQEKTLLLEDHRNREGVMKQELEKATQEPIERPKRFLGIFPRKTG